VLASNQLILRVTTITPSAAAKFAFNLKKNLPHAGLRFGHDLCMTFCSAATIRAASHSVSTALVA